MFVPQVLGRKEKHILKLILSFFYILRFSGRSNKRVKPYVYWTVHHLDSWVKRDQLDVTCFSISLFNAQHISEVNTFILRSLRLMCWVISWVVLVSFDVSWWYFVVWLWWCGIRMQASYKEIIKQVTSSLSLFTQLNGWNIQTTWLSKFSHKTSCVRFSACWVLQRTTLRYNLWLCKSHEEYWILGFLYNFRRKYSINSLTNSVTVSPGQCDV